MKRTIILFVIFSISCQEVENKNPCFETEKKYDSLLKLKKEIDNHPFNKFYSVLSKEKGVPRDSMLLREYENLKGKDSLLDFYIWDRIRTINQNIIKADVYQVFKGTYLLKPNHNKKHAQATKIVINNDSCHVFKHNDLKAKGRFSLINSSDKFVKGKLILKNYKIKLLDFSSKVILLDDNGCVDCEQLQFYKIK